MTTPLLQTKLYIPPTRPELVPRPRLIERLNEGLGLSGSFTRKLTLVSAPAGFGKTTLLIDWLGLPGDAPDLWVLVDHVPAERDRSLKAGELVMFFQPIAGG